MTDRGYEIVRVDRRVRPAHVRRWRARLVMTIAAVALAYGVMLALRGCA